MKRFEERKKDFNNALKRLRELLKEDETDVIIDAALHRYEFTFELAWKTMKDYLEYLGVVDKTGSPREVIQSAYEYGLIEEGEEWIDMMLSRNQLSHLYDEETSRDIYSKIKENYIELLDDLDNKLMKIEMK